MSTGLEAGLGLRVVGKKKDKISEMLFLRHEGCGWEMTHQVDRTGGWAGAAGGVEALPPGQACRWLGRLRLHAGCHKIQPGNCRAGRGSP